MNKVILIGRATREVGLAYTSAGKAQVRFTIAVDRYRKLDGTKDADFIQCVAWDKTAEVVSKYLRKGNLVCVTGRIQTGSYQKDGKTVYTMDVVAESVELLSSRNNNEQATQQAPIAEPKQEPKQEPIQVQADDV